jgi:hypothetical protein
MKLGTKKEGIMVESQKCMWAYHVLFGGALFLEV